MTTTPDYAVMKPTVYTDRRKAALALNTDPRKLWPPLECGDVTLWVFAATEHQAYLAAIQYIWGGGNMKPLSRDQKQQLIHEVAHEMAEELEQSDVST